MSDNDTWLKPLLAKRTPEAIVVLTDLVAAGIRNGECSANDIIARQWTQPNVIGGVFKILPKFGFTHTDRRVKTIAKCKHARRVDVYELTDRWRAEAFLQHQRRLLRVAAGTGQMDLFSIHPTGG